MDKKGDESKDKREAGGGYASSGHSTHTLQIQPSHEDSNTVSIGAGYSIGGKPSLSYEGHQGAQYQFASPQPQHQTIQLAPITLQPAHGGFGSASDLSQLMSQLTHGLQTGAISLQQAEPSQHYGAAQEVAIPQYTYGEQKLQQYSVSEPTHTSPPSYAAGSKGLGSYSTGPVLFNPSDPHNQQAAFNYVQAGHSFSDSASSFPGLSFGHGAGHSLSSAGYGSGGHGHSLSGSGLVLGHSFGGGAGHGHFGGASFGKSIGAPYIKSLGSYGAPSKSSFKPSAFLGASAGDASHGLSSIAGSFSGAPSFGHPGSHGALAISTGHAPSFGGSLGGLGGSSKYTFGPKAESYAGSGSFDSSAAFAAAGGHTTSPGVSYLPSGTFTLSSGSGHSGSHAPQASQAASIPQYYISQSKIPSSSFGESSSAYRAPAKSHSSFSLGPKYSSHGNHGQSYSSSSSHFAPKDIQGSYSENSYNTIKYSEELKPRSH